MKTITKIASALISLGVLAVAPFAAALSAPNITLDPGTSQNGQFSTIVYEDSGTVTVTGAKLELTFSQTVSNVSYDYSVGPFNDSVTDDGMHLHKGAVTGRNALARVNFTLANPGTVVVDVSANSSLWHVEGAAPQAMANLAIGESYFTYSLPAPAPVVKKPAATTPVTAPTPAPATDTPASIDTGTDSSAAVKGTNDNKKAKQTGSSHTGAITSSVAAIVVAGVVVAYWLAMRGRTETAPVKAYKLNTSAEKKPARKKTTGKK